MPAVKFGRNYILTIQDLLTGDVKTIKPPFTMKFSINRSYGKAPNFGRVQIYNLNEDSRSFIRKDANDWGFKKTLILKAGYGDDLSVLLSGNVKLAFSERQGVNYITSADVSDAGAAFINSDFSGQFIKGTPQSSILATLAKSLSEYGVSTGVISPRFSTQAKRGMALSGNAMDLMDEITGGGMFIDNGILHCLKDDEYLAGQVLTVSSTYGMIGKPRRDGVNVVFNLIFEPKAYVMQKVRIEIGDTDFDGDYVIRAIAHNGTISETVSETAETEITCTPARYAQAMVKNGQ